MNDDGERLKRYLRKRLKRYAGIMTFSVINYTKYDRRGNSNPVICVLLKEGYHFKISNRNTYYFYLSWLEQFLRGEYVVKS